MGPLFRALISNMGEKRAYAHVERILAIHAHSAACIQGESAAMPSRRVEKLLLRRLRSYDIKSLRITDTASRARSGDILVEGPTKKAIWDSKDYSRPVPWSQVRKLARDVRVCGAAFGVIVAPHGLQGGETCVLCEGVPIHTCVPKSSAEFACLYLTETVEYTNEVTGDHARGEHIRCLLKQLRSDVENLVTVHSLR